MVTVAEAQTLEFRIVRQVKTQPPLTFTVELQFHPDDSGYSAECLELRAFAWGGSLEEAIENLLDVVILVSETLVDDHKKFPHLNDPRLSHAQFIVALGNEEAIKKVLGL